MRQYATKLLAQYVELMREYGWWIFGVGIAIILICSQYTLYQVGKLGEDCSVVRMDRLNFKLDILIARAKIYHDLRHRSVEDEISDKKLSVVEKQAQESYDNALKVLDRSEKHCESIDGLYGEILIFSTIVGVFLTFITVVIGGTGESLASQKSTKNLPLSQGRKIRHIKNRLEDKR